MLCYSTNEWSIMGIEHRYTRLWGGDTYRTYVQGTCTPDNCLTCTLDVVLIV